MNLTHYMTKNYNNNSGPFTPEKQSQTNPIYSELACPELVEGVEPVFRPKNQYSPKIPIKNPAANPFATGL
jgi:hypothetical protein